MGTTPSRELLLQQIVQLERRLESIHDPTDDEIIKCVIADKFVVGHHVMDGWCELDMLPLVVLVLSASTVTIAMGETVRTFDLDKFKVERKLSRISAWPVRGECVVVEFSSRAKHMVRSATERRVDLSVQLQQKKDMYIREYVRNGDQLCNNGGHLQVMSNRHGVWVQNPDGTIRTITWEDVVNHERLAEEGTTSVEDDDGREEGQTV